MIQAPVDIWLAALPLAAVLALSPVHVVPSLLILTGDRPRAAAAFVAAWTMGVAAVVAGGVVLGQATELAVPPVDDGAAVVVKAALGVMLVLAAVRHWRRRGHGSPPPAWWDSLSTATQRRAGVMGLALSAANPKVVLLAGAAGMAAGAGQTGAPPGFVVGFTAVASVTVVVPLLARRWGGDRMARWLRVLRDRTRTHHAQSMAAVFAVLGTVLLMENAIAW